MGLQSLHDKDYAVITDAVVVDKIPIDVELAPRQVDVDKYPHLRDVKIHELSPLPKEVEILIGSNLAGSMMPEEGSVRRGRDNQLCGYLTKWGWTIAGPTSLDERASSFSSAFITFDNAHLNKQMTDVFDSDHLNPPMKSPQQQPQPQQYHENNKLSMDDLEALKLMQNSVRLVNGRYEVSPLWKKPREEVAKEMAKIPSKATAHRRLVRLGQRLEKEPVEWGMIKTQIETFIREGYAEVVEDYTPGKDDIPEGQPCFYLPLLPTQDKRKPEKRRLTHDCAAKTWGKCLNDYFHRGPDLLNCLNVMLLRYREKPWALMGDIEAFFMRVCIPEEHRNAFRFLFWREEPVPRET